MKILNYESILKSSNFKLLMKSFDKKLSKSFLKLFLKLKFICYYKILSKWAVLPKKLSSVDNVQWLTIFLISLMLIHLRMIKLIKSRKSLICPEFLIPLP